MQPAISAFVKIALCIYPIPVDRYVQTSPAEWPGALIKKAVFK